MAPYNGSGGFSYPANSFNPAIGGTTISSADNNSILSDAETAFSMVQTVDGQSTITNNLPMSGFKHTGVNPNSGSTSRTEYTSGGTVQDNVIMDAGLTTGTSTVYAATLSPAITAYVDKACYRVQFDEACGNNPTINFNSVGAKKIYKNVAGTATQLIANDVYQNQIAFLRYDTALDGAAGGFWLHNAASAATVSYNASTSGLLATNVQVAIDDLVTTGFRYGLLLSRQSGTACRIGTGVARSTDGSVAIRASSNIDINAATTGANGLDVGSLANTTFYYAFVIYNPTTGTTSGLLSTSVSSPTLPSGYTKFRRVKGGLRTDGSAQFLACTIRGMQNREVWYSTAIESIATTLANTDRTLFTVAVPPSMTGRFNFRSNGGGSGQLYISPTFVSDQAATSTGTPGASMTVLTSANTSLGPILIAADSSSQIAARVNVTNTGFNGSVLGFIDDLED